MLPLLAPQRFSIACLTLLLTQAIFALEPKSTVIAKVAGPAEIQLSWKDTFSDETSFRIDRRSDKSEDWTAVGFAPPDTTQFQDTDTTPGESYIYAVFALKGDAETKAGESRITAGPPAQPVGLASSAASSPGIAIRWTDSADNEVQYLVERKSGTSGEFEKIATLPPNSISYFDPSAKAGIHYVYRVQAENLAGGSDYSEEFPATAGGKRTVATTNGLRGEYFSNSTLSGAPALVETNPTIDFNWGSKSPAMALPADGFSVCWKGEIEAAAAGDYTFYVAADEGVRLFIGTVPIIDTWAKPSSGEKSGVAKFTAGQKQDIRLEYYDRTADARVSLQWAGPGMAKAIIPSARLFSPAISSAKDQGLLNVEMREPFPASMSTRIPVKFELWQLGGTKATTKKFSDIKDHARYSVERLPPALQFRFKAPVDHDRISVLARSSDSFNVMKWGPAKHMGEAEPIDTLYRLSHVALPPKPGKYCIEVTAEKAGAMVAHTIINFEFAGKPGARRASK